MADKRNRSKHRASDRPDLTWLVWAEKYAPTTANSSAEQLSSLVDDDVMRINHQDVGLYGLCPRQDECCLVVCNQCRQLIRLQALYGHYERRHSHYLTGGRHQHSSTQKEVYKNTNSNGPYAPSENVNRRERQSSSSESSDCVHSSAKETKVSSSRRKLSLSSQWDSDDSTSESCADNYSDSVRKYINSNSKDYRRHRSGNTGVAKRPSTEASVRLSDSSKSFSKNSVQVNGIKVVASSDLPQSVGANNLYQAAASTVSVSKSSKHMKSSSQAISESFSVAMPTKSQAAKLDSSWSSSATLTKTKDRNDSGHKKFSASSQASPACKAKDSSTGTKDKLCSVSYSSKSVQICDSSSSAKQNARDTTKSSKSHKSSTVHSDRDSSSHSKSKHVTVEKKSHSNHHQTSGSVSVSSPAVSRLNSSEEYRHTSVPSKSAVLLPLPKVSHNDSPKVETIAADTRFSARTSVSRDSVFNFSSVSEHVQSKSVPNSVDERVKCSSSRSASKTAQHSALSQDLPCQTSQQHISKSSHPPTSHSNSIAKSDSLHSPDVAVFKLNLKTDSRLNLESKPSTGSSFSAKTCQVEQRNIPIFSHKESLSGDISPASICTTIEHETSSLGKSPEDLNLNLLVKKASKSQDKPKSSSQFCKDREFDPDKHCGVTCADTGKPCTHSLTCKIHALSLRRSVPGRTKPFDQLLSEHRLLREAQRKKHELQQKSKSFGDTTSVPVQVTSSSSTSRVETQRTPSVSAVRSSFTGNSFASCQQSLGSQFSARPPRPRPKPRFRTSLFRSSKWFSVLRPAAGSKEKQIARPVKLPLFHANGAISLSDESVPTANGDVHSLEVVSGFNSHHQTSSYLMHHPKPVAINRFGAWKFGQGCTLFSRKGELSRSIFEEMLDSEFLPPPHKKLCVESSLPVEMSESRELLSSRDPYCFATGEVSSTNVAFPFASSSSDSSAFLPPVGRHSSNSRARYTTTTTTSFRNPGLILAKNSESPSVVLRKTSDTGVQLSSQYDPPANHRHSSITNSALPSPDALGVKSDSLYCKTLPTGRTANILNSTFADARLQNGHFPPSGSGKKHLQSNVIEDKGCFNESGRWRMHRTAEGPRIWSEESKVKSGSMFKAAAPQFKDSTSRVTDGSSNKQTLGEAARPSVIAFGSPASQKFPDISSHQASSLANLNGLQSSYRSLSGLNHKPQHNFSVVSKDHHLSSQGTLSSSAKSLKNSAQVNRTTLGVPTM